MEALKTCADREGGSGRVCKGLLNDKEVGRIGGTMKEQDEVAMTAGNRRTKCGRRHAIGSDASTIN